MIRLETLGKSVTRLSAKWGDTIFLKSFSASETFYCFLVIFFHCSLDGCITIFSLLPWLVSYSFFIASFFIELIVSLLYSFCLLSCYFTLLILHKISFLLKFSFHFFARFAPAVFLLTIFFSFPVFPFIFASQQTTLTLGLILFHPLPYLPCNWCKKNLPRSPHC